MQNVGEIFFRKNNAFYYLQYFNQRLSILSSVNYSKAIDKCLIDRKEGRVHFYFLPLLVFTGLGHVFICPAVFGVSKIHK